MAKMFDFKDEFDITITCASGVEKVVKSELKRLGYEDAPALNGTLSFKGDMLSVARCNMFLRSADRVYIKVAEFSATTFDELFDGATQTRWEDFVPVNAKILVNGKCVKSTLFAVSACQSIVKKAMVSRLSGIYGINWFEEIGVKYQIEFFIFKDIATLMIDTTGVPLHKRGYRPAAGAAPLRETLGAAIAMTTRPRENVLLWDPFCGSGTIVIEAAMMMKGIAPGLNRRFAAEQFGIVTPQAWKDARAEARSMIKSETDFEAWGSDIDLECLEYAKANASRAGVDDVVKFFKADARRIEKPDRRGTLVCNPPYGERLMTEREVEKLYADIGKCFDKFDPWQMYILTSCESFQRNFGRRADKVRKLYNGMIPCNLYQYFKPKNK